MRLQGWEIRFADYLDRATFKKFKWGECDCLIFAVTHLSGKTDQMVHQLNQAILTVNRLFLFSFCF